MQNRNTPQQAMFSRTKKFAKKQILDMRHFDCTVQRKSQGMGKDGDVPRI
jgi:hypothetical protein